MISVMKNKNHRQNFPEASAYVDGIDGRGIYAYFSCQTLIYHMILIDELWKLRNRRGSQI